MDHNRRKKVIKLTAIILGSFLVLAAVFGIYVSDYYKADSAAITNFSYSGNISKTALSDDCTAYIPEQAQYGMIFYPGGKVDHSAYEPLMLACAEQGILCLLLEMPFRLAVLDGNAADGLIEQFPEIIHWYMAGHSLGGSMAASYLSKNGAGFDGLILLASYSTADLRHGDKKVLSIYGSEDKVLNAEKYEEYTTNLPSDFSQHIIEGGSHAYFGMYGAQKGDGTPSISNEEQIRETAKIIIDFMKK